MPNINKERLINELQKGDIDQKIEAFQYVKNYIADCLSEAQKQADERASQLQNQLDRINNTQ